MPDVPDFVRRAMEAQGRVDPDAVAEALADADVIPSDEDEQEWERQRREVRMAREARDDDVADDEPPAHVQEALDVGAQAVKPAGAP